MKLLKGRFKTVKINKDKKNREKIEKKSYSQNQSLCIWSDTSFESSKDSILLLTDKRLTYRNLVIWFPSEICSPKLRKFK